MHVMRLLLEQKMSLLRYLKPSNALPTAKQTGFNVNKVVNSAVQESFERDQTSRKRKYTTTFTLEDHTSRGPNKCGGHELRCPRSTRLCA